MPRTIAIAVIAALLSFTAAGAAVRAAEPATAATARTFDEPAARRALDAAVATARERGFSGTVLLAQHGRTLYQASLGVADRTRAAAVDERTRFNLASTGKLFTAVAILQLVERGKLDLDATVGRYLPDWPQAQVRDAVTLRHLLTHSSGLGNFFALPDYAARRTQLRSLADHVPLIGTNAPAFTPGSDFAYSNTGFVVLGLVVEAVSGEDYYDYIGKHVFAPAGMRDSGYYDRDGRAENVATGYVALADGGVESNDGTREWRGSPAGGGYATAADMVRFRTALFDGRLLTRASVDRWLVPPTTGGTGPRALTGLGALIKPVDGDVLFGHPGGAPGIASEFLATRDSGYVLVIFANVAPPPRMGVPNPVMDFTHDVVAAIASAGGPSLAYRPARQPPGAPPPR